jgi:hypothetical protein
MLAHPRRPQVFIAYLLALVMVSGAVLPSPWLWHCHHAAQIVASPQQVSAAAMPCKDMAMASMPCCHSAGMGTAHRAHHLAISAPDCHPTFTQLATLPAAQLNSDQFRQHLATALAFSALNTSPVLQFSLTTPQLRRPPPVLNLPASLRLHTLAPRAPPIA